MLGRSQIFEKALSSKSRERSKNVCKGLMVPIGGIWVGKQQSEIFLRIRILGGQRLEEGYRNKWMASSIIGSSRVILVRRCQ